MESGVRGEMGSVRACPAARSAAVSAAVPAAGHALTLTRLTLPSSYDDPLVMPLVCCLCFACSCAFQFYAAMCFQCVALADVTHCCHLC